MFSVKRIRAALALLAFLLACFFAGFANEKVKQVLPDFDRAILLIGFVLGAGSAARWIASGSFAKTKRGDR
jgi:hypothetical protein